MMCLETTSTRLYFASSTRCRYFCQWPLVRRPSFIWFAFASPSDHLSSVRTSKEARNNGQTEASNWPTENRGLFKRTLFRGGLIRKQQVLLSEGHRVPWGAGGLPGAPEEMGQIVINTFQTTSGSWSRVASPAAGMFTSKTFLLNRRN